MKKKLIIMLVGVFSFGIATNCIAGTYFSGNVGIVSVSDAAVTDAELTALGLSNVELSFDNGVGLSLAVGSTITDIIRAEGEFSYIKNDLDSFSASDGFITASMPINGEIEAMSLMGNIFAEIKTNSAIKPFVGLGLGFSKLDAEIEGDSEDDTVFTYQLILGTGIEVNESTSIDLSYRYFAPSDPDFDGTEVEVAAHKFMAGVRLNF